jgi:hypothetical protein
MEFEGSSWYPQDPTKSGVLYDNNSDVFYSEGS